MTFKKIISLCLCALLVLSAVVLMPFSADAAEADGVYNGVDGSVLSSVIDDMEDDFNIATVGWSVKGGYAEAVSDMGVDPYSPYEGSRSLVVYADGSKVTVSKKPTVTRTISNYKYLVLAVWVPQSAGNTTLNLRCTASRGVFTETKTLENGIWQTVFFDVSESKKGTVSNIELTFTASGSSENYFLIDCFGGCKETTDPDSARYLAKEINAIGCQVSLENHLKITLLGLEHSVQLTSPTALPSDGMGIRVDLINRSTSRTLTLSYIVPLGDIEQKKSITVSLPESANKTSYLFALPNENINSIFLSLDSGAVGEAEISAISLSPCYTPQTGVGQISECRIARDKKSISLKGSISENDVEKYEDSVLYLYELGLTEDISSITPSHSPVAEAKLNGSAFSFTVPLDESLNGIFKKYAVMIYYNGSLVPVTSASSVNNPELLAEEKASLPDGKKGIWPLPHNYVLDGVDQTVIEIMADELMTLSTDGAVSHTVGGVRYSFSSEYLAELDKKMTEYEREGIAVRFVLRLRRPEDLSLSVVLCHPQYDGGEYAAFNTVTDEGIRALRAITDFLVRRYGTDDGASSNLFCIVLGTNVNDAYDNYNMGHASLSYFTEHYGAALRTVYNTARGICSDFAVSSSLGGNWYSGSTASQKASFDARTVFEALSACIKDGTDIGWELSYDITPEKGNYAWKNTSPYYGADARKITAANLEVLTEYMSLARLHYNGSSRGLLLLGTEIREAENENDRINLSADYIYTWLRISSRNMKQITGYIPSHPADYENAFRYVGTELFAESSVFASELMGKECFDALTLDSGIDRHYKSSSLLSTAPSSVKGETVLFSFAKNEGGFEPSLNCASVEGGISYSGLEGLLRVRLEGAESGELRGISVISPQPLDLSVAPYLSFTVRSAVTRATELELFVVIYSGDSLHVSSGVISASEDNTVVCDISSFANLSSCDRIGIYVRGVNGEDIEEPTLMISSIKALSESLSGSELDTAIRNPSGRGIKTVSVYKVITVAVICVVAFVTEAIRIFLKIKRKDENE